jgi:hypothetical protein
LKAERDELEHLDVALVDTAINAGDADVMHDGRAAPAVTLGVRVNGG